MAGTRQLDPIKYIENAFLDRRPKTQNRPQPTPRSAIKGRFRKTALSAPRPRMSAAEKKRQVIDPELRELIENLPRNLEFLAQFYDDGVTSKYYSHEFKETRSDLMRRLLDPELTLEEVSRLLGVCPATIRRYTNRGWLEHHRTKGGQRRFRLSAVAKHVEEHGRLPEK
ncbi:MAG TPA: helix-turn-helix domain-containing protein [Fimbriimonadaceae bacterium]|nr:helix-turn-helix domain-containing protein [Fimbriimonadaceae bacterium]